MSENDDLLEIIDLNLDEIDTDSKQFDKIVNEKYYFSTYNSNKHKTFNKK